MKENKNILERVELLEELIEQQKLGLLLSDDIINLNSELIELYEKQADNYRSLIYRLKKSLMISAITLAVIFILHVTSLLV
jgi:hypothetical protein